MVLRSILYTCRREALANMVPVVKVMQIFVPGGGACTKLSFAKQSFISRRRRRLGHIFASLLLRGSHVYNSSEILPRLLVHVCKMLRKAIPKIVPSGSDCATYYKVNDRGFIHLSKTRRSSHPVFVWTCGVYYKPEVAIIKQTGLTKQTSIIRWAGI